MILGISTHSENISIALYQKDKCVQEKCWISYRTQSRELIIEIDKMLHQEKVKLDNLDMIAVFQGPGSFTGLRVGISIANTMAWTLNIPVVGIKSKVRLSALKVAKKAKKHLDAGNILFNKQIIPYYNFKLK